MKPIKDISTKLGRFFKSKIVIGMIVFGIVLRGLFLLDPEQFKDTLRRIPFLPDKVVNTFRFFPDYNPFAKELRDDVPTLGENFNIAFFGKRLSQGSIVVRLLLPFPNGGVSREVFVYLPKNYDPEQSTRYPTLYLLSGSPGEASDWLIAANAQSTLDVSIGNGEIRPTIVVFPDGNGGANRDTEFINSADGKELNEDFLVKTVVDFIDAKFMTIPKPEYRSIGGASSGGFGALNLGLKHQDLFGSILSFSGYGRIDQIPLTDEVIQGSQDVIRNNSPLDYIPGLSIKTVKTLLIVDNQRGSAGDTEDISNMLSTHGFQADTMSFKGKHTYPFWGDHLGDALRWLAPLWKEQ